MSIERGLAQIRREYKRFLTDSAVLQDGDGTSIGTVQCHITSDKRDGYKIGFAYEQKVRKGWAATINGRTYRITFVDDVSTHRAHTDCLAELVEERESV